MCPGTRAWYLVQTSFVTLLVRTLGAFGNVSEKAFCVQVPWGVPFPFRRQEGTHLGSQGTYHLKLLLLSSLSERPNRCDFCSNVCSIFQRFSATRTCRRWEKNLQGLKSWAWPKGSAEFWGTFGIPDPSFEDQLFSSQNIQATKSDHQSWRHFRMANMWTQCFTHE